jgi:hypothetical protein
VYRGQATSYNYNYGGELLASKGGFELLPYDDQVFGCPFPVECPTTNGLPTFLTPGDTLLASPPCDYLNIKWYNTNSITEIGQGSEYTVRDSDVNGYIYYVVTYSDGSTDTSSQDCFPVVTVSVGLYLFYLFNRKWSGGFATENPAAIAPELDAFGNFYVQSWWDGGGVPPNALPAPNLPVISKVDRNGYLTWSYDYKVTDGHTRDGTTTSAHCLINNKLHCFSIRKSTTDFQKIYLSRLIIDTDSGTIEKIDGLEYVCSMVSSVNSNILRVFQVNTDFKGNFWLLATVFEEFTVSGITTRVAGVLLKLTESSTGELTTNWSYEILRRYVSGITSRYSGTSAEAFWLDLNKNIIYTQGWPQASFARPTPVILNATTGSVIYKQPFATVNGSPTILGYRVNYIDDENNLYQLANNSNAQKAISVGSAVWVSKKDSNKNIVWMKDYQTVITRDCIAATNSMIKINDKLVIVLGFAIGTPTRHYPVLLVINSETGTLERNVQVTTPSNSSDLGDDCMIRQSNNPNEFILYSSFGFYLNLNVTNIPINTTLVCRSTNQTYVFTDNSISGVTDYTSYAETGLGLPPDRTWNVTEAYYTLPVASGELITPGSSTVLSGVYVA